MGSKDAVATVSEPGASRPICPLPGAVSLSPARKFCPVSDNTSRTPVEETIPARALSREISLPGALINARLATVGTSAKLMVRGFPLASCTVPFEGLVNPGLFTSIVYPPGLSRRK